MKTIGNIFWFILGGFLISLYYAVVGILFCVSIIGIPFGVQLFKMAGLALWPFGHEVKAGPNDTGCLSIFMNIIWVVCGGVEISIMHLTFGLICCLTIVGIPFGLQHFKMAAIAFVPFGKVIS